MALLNTLQAIEWNRNFTLFAVASFVSGAGNALIPIAFSIEALTVSPSGAGIALVMLALWSGRFLGIQGYGKLTLTHLKSVMIVSDLVRLCAQSGLLIYIVLAPNTILAMSVSAFVYGLASSFYLPASFQMIPKITHSNSREQANSVLAILGDIYSIIGPLAGVSLVLFLGFEVVLLIDSVTFLIAIVLISIVTLTPSADSNTAPAPQVEQDTPLVPTPDVTLPAWSVNGLKSWFFVSVCLGFLGVAAPAMVIQNHSESAWAMVATCIAIGSLAGSTGMLTGRFKNVAWNRLHLLCLFLLPLQLLAVSSLLPMGLIVICAMLGACATTMSGIKWDTVTQSRLTDGQLPHFASADQMVTNTAVPLGMTLFGITSHFGISDYGMVAVVITVVFSCWFVRAEAPQAKQELMHD